MFIKDTLSGRKVNQNFEIKVLEVLKTYEKISIVWFSFFFYEKKKG